MAHALDALVPAGVGPAARAIQPVNPSQRASTANMPPLRKHTRYSHVSKDDLSEYFAVSCVPITKVAEDDMEELSDLVTWGERYHDHWKDGTYNCSRCRTVLYDSSDKWHGPCVWPSFRAVSDSAMARPVVGYNGYSCRVFEIYCQCQLFIGHAFEDGRSKGDSHSNAHWRH